MIHFERGIATDNVKQIDTKTASANFSGRGKSISKERMMQLTADVNAAKAAGDYIRSKDAKRR